MLISTEQLHELLMAMPGRHYITQDRTKVWAACPGGLLVTLDNLDGRKTEKQIREFVQDLQFSFDDVA